MPPELAENVQKAQPNSEPNSSDPQTPQLSESTSVDCKSQPSSDPSEGRGEGPPPSEGESSEQETGPRLRPAFIPSGHSLTDQLRRGIFEEDFRIDPNKVVDPTQRRRGRPENEVDMSPVALKRLIDNVTKGLVNKVKGEQRSDARTASICRHLAKIPDHFLKALGSKCRYKSSDVSEVLSSYVKAFVGFIRFYKVTVEEVGEDYLTSMFFDFISLKFPENKVKAMISFFKEEGLLSVSDVSSYSAILKERKSASKKSFRLLFEKNKAFQICIKNTQMFLHGDLKAPEVISKVLESLEKED
jgi:hypothetical protein